MDTSSEKKTAFGLSGDQISRLLSIGLDDDTRGEVRKKPSSAEGNISLSGREQPSDTCDASPQIEGYEIVARA